MRFRQPEPDYNIEYHYELVGGPLCGRVVEILGREYIVATGNAGEHGRYRPNEVTGFAYWTEGDAGAAPATAPGR